METEPYKPIFECTLKEMEDRLRPVIEKVEAENLKAGFYNIYHYGNSKKICLSTNMLTTGNLYV